MDFTQRIHPEGRPCQLAGCRHPSGPGWLVIDTVDREGNVRVCAHANAAIHPEHRLNGSHPAEDHRGPAPVPVTRTEMCEACKQLPAVPAGQP